MPKTTITKDEFLARAREIINVNPMDRLADPARKAIESGNYIHDVHVHTFDKRAINEVYFLVKMIGSVTKSWLINRFSIFNPALSISKLEGLEPVANPKIYGDPISDEEFAVYQMLEHLKIEDIEEFYEKYETEEIPDWSELEGVLRDSEEKFQKISSQFKIESYREFIRFVRKEFYGENADQEHMLNHYLTTYAISKHPNFSGKTMVSSVLMMDFYKEHARRVPTDNLWKQIDHLNALAEKKPMIPYLALDPRRVDDTELDENLYELFIKAFDHKNGGKFFGVKLYPALGYSPSDPRLEPFYEICEEFGIPVVTHCGGESVSTFDRNIWVYSDFDKSKRIRVQGNTREKRAYFLNDPERFVPVFDKYKKLKINLAHFGSNQAWIEKPDDIKYRKRIDTILGLMNEYKGAFTDFSFSLADQKTFDKLKSVLNEHKIVQDRLMYGTDYWVVLFNKGDRFINNLNGFVTDIFQDPSTKENMLVKNPDKYLFDPITLDENQ